MAGKEETQGEPSGWFTVRRGVRTPSRGFQLFSECSLSSLYMPNIRVQNHIMSVICYVNIFFFFFTDKHININKEKNCL